MRKTESRSGDLLPGTLDMLILKTLIHGEMHGFAIAERIEETSHEVLRVDEGALYTALYRIELRGLVASECGTSKNNRRAKYYHLTAAVPASSRGSRDDSTGVAHHEVEPGRFTSQRMSISSVA